MEQRNPSRQPKVDAGRANEAGRRPALLRPTKTRGVCAAGSKAEFQQSLDLFNQARLDRLDGNPDALGAAVGGPDANALKIGPELALRDAGHVRADAAALLGLAL